MSVPSKIQRLPSSKAHQITFARGIWDLVFSLDAMESELSKYSIPLRSPRPDFSKLKAVRYSADKATSSVCVWHGQCKGGGGGTGTVSSEQVNPSSSLEIQSPSFASSPVSPKVVSKRLLENSIFTTFKQASTSKPLDYPWFSPFYIRQFLFPLSHKTK